jgi:phosphate acetyltransferase
MNTIGYAKSRIRGKGLRIVLPEGDDERIREAAQRLSAERLAEPIVLCAELDDPPEEEVAAVVRLRPNMGEALAARLLRKQLPRAGAMVASGKAAAMVAGASHATARVIEAALMTIGLAPGINTPSSFFLMRWPDRRLIFADCAVNVQPSAEELADIALASASSARLILEEEPRVALLSFATHIAAGHPDAEKVNEACSIAQKREPGLKIDGGLQGDAALAASVAAKKIKRPSEVAGQANVLVFPDLDAGNIGYKLVQYLSGAQAIGPILQGFAKPVSDLSRGATIDDIIATSCLLLSMAAMKQAQGRDA